MLPDTASSISEVPFEKEVTSVLARMRNALAEIIAAVPDHVGKGADLHRALRIDRKLSWKVFKLATAPDPVAAGTLVPSPAKLETFFKAAAKRGVPQGRIEAAARVSAEFEDVVIRHANDRATFDSMISTLADEETTEQIDLAYRRLAFRGTRHALGLHAKAKLITRVVQTSSSDSRLLDIASVAGYIAIRRLRGNAALFFSASGARNDDGSIREIKAEPIDPVPESGGVALLKEFCSKPLPQIRATEAESGVVDYELVASGVGNRAAVTCLEGHMVRGAVPRYRDEMNHNANFFARAYCPCDVLVFDLLVREDTFGERLAPSMTVYSEHFRKTPSGSLRESQRLPLHAPVIYLGQGPSVLHSPDIPRYAEMGRYLFDRLGWDGDRFDVYRCRVEYPVTPSAITIHFDLPEAPQKQ